MFFSRLQKYLKIKRVSDHSTLHKFFKKMLTDMFGIITTQIIAHLEIRPKLLLLMVVNSPATTQTNITQKYVVMM
ncbi:hypothetical protein [Methanobrevibacter sp.]|uniref:hypothetical protein n=1 Tax=Methanobrevibacter sp. TaxID=66852 RepID=UPI003865082F